MSDHQSSDLTEAEAIETARRNADANERAARHTQFGQQGSRIDPGLGNLGGAGSSGGIQPDIAKQSKPLIGG